MNNVEGDIDELMSHLGEFGKYQAWQFSLHIIGGLTAGLHMLTLLTVAAVPDHQCARPNNWTTDDKLFKCHYLDSNNVTIPCDSWTYDTTYYKSSRGMDWNFVCSREWMGAVVQSSYMFGVFVGAVSLGSLADKYGRKIIFYVSAVAQLVLGVGVAFVSEYYTFVVIRFFYGIFGSAGAYITGFVLTMELVGPSRRTICGVMFQIAFASGFMLVAIWGAIVKDRMWLQITYGLHSALLIGHWWLMDESPRWLWSQGRAKESLDIVQRALKMNGSNIKLDTAKYVSKSKLVPISATEEPPNQSVVDLLRLPNLRKKTLNVCFNWFANSIAYYGLSLSKKNLDGNPYLTMFLRGLVELPAYIFLCLFMDRMGRRCLISTFMLIGGICCILAAFLSESDLSNTIPSGIRLLGKACISGSFAIIYNYTAELFPTVIRNTALGIGSMSARLGGALTPLVILLGTSNPVIPATIFGLIALLSGFLSLFLPETVNQPMPETMEDGENFGIGDTCFTTCLGNRKSRKVDDNITMRQVVDREKEVLSST